MGRPKLTTDQELIRQWADERHAKPASVEDENGQRSSVMLEFLENGSASSHQRIQWRTFFSEMEDKGMCFLYRETASDKTLSHFYKLIHLPTGILQQLHDEHEKVLDLFDKLESTTQNALITRSDGAQSLNELLRPHMKGEQKVFYKALKSACENDRQRVSVLEGYEEHTVAKKALKQLLKADPEKPEWEARFKVLRELIEHHIQEEVAELFDLAHELLGDEHLNELQEQYTQKEEKTLAKMS